MLEPSVTLSKVHQPVQKNNAQLHSEKKERIRSSWIGLDRTGFARGCMGLVLMQVLLNGFWMILVLVSVEMFDFRAAAEFGCYINIYQSRGHENAEYTAPPKSARCSSLDLLNLHSDFSLHQLRIQAEKFKRLSVKPVK